MKTHYCFLARFNNYFNRKIIKYDTLLEYENHSEESFIPLTKNNEMASFDFNPNDNVTTEIIGNDVPFTPDYFLILDDDENIISRWFVLEEKRQRNGQWLYTLRRDVISDNLEDLIQSPIYVQKGMLADENPLILNDEGMNFNKIKTEEKLLKDVFGKSWLVAYLAKSAGGSDINVQVPTEEIENYVSLNDIATELGVSQSILLSLLNFNGDTITPTRFINKFLITFSSKGIIFDTTTYLWFSNRNYSIQKGSIESQSVFPLSHPLYSGDTGGIAVRFQNQVIANSNALIAQMKTIMGSSYYFTYDKDFLKLKEYAGKYVKYLDQYYQLNLVEAGDDNRTDDSYFAYTKYSSLQTIAVNATGGATLNSGGLIDRFATYGRKVYIQLNLVSDSDVVTNASVKISSTRKTTVDQQFDIIATPAETAKLSYDDNGNTIQFEHIGDLARKIINKLAIQEDANVYDVQLLPYCPVPQLNESTLIAGTEEEDYDFISLDNTDLEIEVNAQYGTLPEDIVEIDAQNYNVTSRFNVQTESGKTVTVDSITISGQQSPEVVVTNITCSIDDATGVMTINYDAYTPDFYQYDVTAVRFLVHYHYAGVSKAGVIFYVKKASFQSIIRQQLTLKESMKVDSQCDMYRILSPNYQGSFDFNVAKNGGFVEYFTAYCTYKPYTPFIKVCPAFSFVYGMDYNDNRGLICSGDFSLPRISSAWQSYQLNNKNYQNIFNRDIQNLDFTMDIQMRNQLISGAVGIFGDVAKGAGAGLYLGGGPAGALVGGGVSAITSGIGYVIDVETMTRSQRENRQYTIDKYNYQLGNIKALPYTLTKVGAFDISSKIFPVLEYYTCSEQEKEALKNKIKYESMTVMTIGKLGDYINSAEPHYFKGELIRCDDIVDDYHMLETIYYELLKGVYI